MFSNTIGVPAFRFKKNPFCSFFLKLCSMLRLKTMGFFYIKRLLTSVHPVPCPFTLSVSLKLIHFERQRFFFSGCWNRRNNEAIQHSGIVTFSLLRCPVAVARRGATGTETGQVGRKKAGVLPGLDHLHCAQYGCCKCLRFRKKNIMMPLTFH